MQYWLSISWTWRNILVRFWLNLNEYSMQIFNAKCWPFCFRLNVLRMLHGYHKDSCRKPWYWNLFWKFHRICILTFNVLNCFEDYKSCIHISYGMLDFIQQKKIKFTMEQLYVLPILYCQCHACWCTGEFRSQCISRHGIEFQSRNIPSLASEELMFSIIVVMCVCKYMYRCACFFFSCKWW